MRSCQLSKIGFLILFIISFHTSCSQRRDNSDLQIFDDKEIGWKTKYPSSWNVMTAEEIAKVEGRGKDAMEKTFEGEMTLTHRNLLWFKKDVFNTFTSSAQPYDSADGPYAETQKAVHEAVTETFKSQGIEFDMKLGKAMIDGLEFFTMETIIYSRDRKKILMYQVMYDRLIDGKNSLTLNINYNNDADKATLLDVINSSKLSKRK